MRNHSKQWEGVTERVLSGKGHAGGFNVEPRCSEMTSLVFE